MVKDSRVAIRLSHQQKENIKKYCSTPTEIFELGYEKWTENITEFLKEKAEYYHNLYTQCTNKLADCTHDVHTKMSNLETLRQEYIDTNRSIDDPDKMDISWVEGRIRKMDGVSVEKFFKYCSERKEVSK